MDKTHFGRQRIRPSLAFGKAREVFRLSFIAPEI
jgi:hypothetical protein